MSDRKLAILFIVAVVMVMLAVIQSQISTGPAQSETPGYLITGLNTDRIGSIAIGKGDDIITLKRVGPRFVVTNKDNYPAKISEINNLLTKCQEIRWTQFITDNPANHEDLEVAEENARGIVRFLTPEPNSAILAGVATGKTREVGEGTYVRLLSSDKKSSDKVYLAQDVPFFNNDVMDYIEQMLISCKFEDIESVTVASSSGEYTLTADPNSKEIILENIPEGKKLKASESKNVFTALANFRFDDVRKTTSGLLFDRKYVCRLKNTAVYTIDIARKDDETYIICDADFTDTVERPTKDETDEQLKEKEAKLLAWETAKDFSLKHKGWIYKIPQWNAKNMTMELSGLLDDDTARETEIPAEPNSAGIDKLIDSPNIEDANYVSP